VRNYIKERVKYLEEHGNFSKLKKYKQHNNYTTFDHCISVAKLSLYLAVKFHIKIDKDELVTAALLHDYYLYDWHDFTDKTHTFHGFRHGKTASINAVRDYNINKRQMNAIERHMFPLTLPPTNRMGIIITIADKYCAFKEIFVKKQKVLKNTTYDIPKNRWDT